MNTPKYKGKPVEDFRNTTTGPIAKIDGEWFSVNGNEREIFDLRFRVNHPLPPERPFSPEFQARAETLGAPPVSTEPATVEPVTAQEIAETEQLIAKHVSKVRERARIEVAIIREIMKAFTAAGLEIHADNGEEEPIKLEKGNDLEFIRALMAVDESRITAGKPGERKKWVFLVFGNSGTDLICDHSADDETERLLEPVSRLADFFEEGGNAYTRPR